MRSGAVAVYSTDCIATSDPHWHRDHVWHCQFSESATATATDVKLRQK